MTKAFVERSTVVILFVLVLIVFSFAERDSKKITGQYNKKSTVETVKKATEYTVSAIQKPLPAAGKN